jgi:hypothetical protein
MKTQPLFLCFVLGLLGCSKEDPRNPQVQHKEISANIVTVDVRYTVDGSDGNVRGRELVERHGFVVLPQQWTIQEGLYEGVTLPLASIVQIKGDSAPKALGRRLRTWREYPIEVFVVPNKVSVRRGHEVRNAVHDVNQQLGWRLFRLGEPVQDDVEGVYVEFVDTLAGDAMGAVRAKPHECRYDVDDEQIICDRHWLSHVRVFLADIAGHAEITHELLHAVGLAHSCVTETIMATEFLDWELAECGYVRYDLGFSDTLRVTRAFSAFDAAALEVLREAALRIGNAAADSFSFRQAVSADK